MLLAFLIALAPLPELAPTAVLFDSGKEGYEISGAAGVGDELWIVSDDADQHYLYRLERKKKEARIKFTPALDLTRLSGWDNVRDAMKEALAVPAKGRRLDLEGLAACPGTLYVANEDVRQVLVIEGQKTIAVAPIDFSAVKDLYDGGANAGFEGIAADCAHGLLYVAKERDPRRIFKIDVKTWKILDAFDLALSPRQGQKVLPFRGIAQADGLLELSPDFGDLAFDGGFLYVIERNTYELSKVDPATKQVVARLSYYDTEKPLYETHEPFGLAEALYLTPTEIWLGLDNNTPVTHLATKTYGYKGSGGAFLVFPRPKGF